MKIYNFIQNNFFLVIIIYFIIFLSGCSKLLNFTKDQSITKKSSCADLVIERAFFLHESAKSGLALFFDERSDDQLYQAFYLASDSVRESRKVRKCWDRKLSHYYAMRNLREMNTSLAKVIRRNLPDDDMGEMVAIFNNQYDWVMPHKR